MATNSIALCVPAFNASAVLPRLFESIQTQTEPFDEVWIYDDASTDDTAAVARNHGARVIQGKVNQGCSAGKNALLAQVGTSWVHFHDSDDMLAPEFVARARRRITGCDFDALLFNYEQVDEQSGLQMSRSHFESSDLQNDPVRYMLSNTVNNGGVYSLELLRRTGGFDSDPAVRFNEDRAFHLRLAEAGARFGIEPYIGSRFFFNPGSMSAANRANCLLANQEITRRFAGRHPEGYSVEIGQLSWHNAAGLAACLDFRAADDCIRLALHHDLRLPHEGSTLFKSLCLINPYWALRVREFLIRGLRPRNRIGFPLLRRAK
jgi:glycosyltransferase involved in cell wall biosynthesis